jgi:hypothetical protein
MVIKNNYDIVFYLISDYSVVVRWGSTRQPNDQKGNGQGGI